MPTVHRRDVVTSDRDEASAALSAGFPGIALSSSDDARPFRFRLSVAGDERFAVHSLALSGCAHGVGTVPEIVAIGGVLSGRFGLTYGRHEVDTTQPYLRLPGASEMRMEDARLALVTFDPAAFRDAAAGYVGTDVVPVGSTPSRMATAPRTRALGTAWSAASGRMLAAADDDEGFASALVRDRLFDMAVRAVLGAFPLGETATPHGEITSSHAVARAIAYIDACVAEHVTLPDIAEAARLSVRGVQYAFQRHLGVTPLSYLRDRRLDACRVELIASDPAVTSVAAVARRWGFAHLSRFAQAYRERFGEYPSVTIRS
jgi:AraC-like DNA-binding protein